MIGDEKPEGEGGLPHVRHDRPETGSGGALATHVTFRHDLFLHADPALGVSGRWRSPPGRLLELDVRTRAPGRWLALHMKLDADDLSQARWLGFACRHAGEGELMIRPCLRSGTEKGFVDSFFAKHILATPEPFNHVDALFLPATRSIPTFAPWRELVLFLPRESLRWHVHDLRPFLV